MPPTGLAGHVAAPLAQLPAVFLAAQPVRVHHRGRLGQGERQAVEVLTEVERLDPLIGVVDQPGGEVRQRFPAAEPADRHDPRAAGRCAGPAAARRAAEGGAWQPGRDDHPAAWSGRPYPGQVGHVSQIVEDQRPRALGVREPGREAARGGLRVSVRVARADRAGRLGVPGEDRLPGARGDPDQDVDGPGAAQRQGVRGGELRLARAALGGRRRLGRLAVGQHHALAGPQTRLQTGTGLQALEVGIGQRRDDSGHQRPGGRRRRLSTLRDHADSLSRGTRRPAGVARPGRGQVLHGRAAEAPGQGRRRRSIPGRRRYLTLVVRAKSLRATILHVHTFTAKRHASSGRGVWPCLGRSFGLSRE